MADVTVKTAEVELRTARLTKSILKQMPVMEYDALKPYLRADGNERPDAVLGWIHGSVLGDDNQWLIIKTGEGTYGRYNAMRGTCSRYPQIYVI
jgi:hypothetical protein